MSWNCGIDDAKSDSGGAGYLRRLKAGQQQTVEPHVDHFSSSIDRATPAISAQLSSYDGTSADLKAGSNSNSSDPTERRRSPRFKCEGSAEFRVGGTDVRTWGTFTDLSVSGCYIEMTATFPVGAIVDLVLGLNGFRVRVKGEVRVSYPFLGMGVFFREISPENERELQAMVRSLDPAANHSSDPATNSAAAGPEATGQTSIVAIASPEAAFQAVVDFFQRHSLLSRDEFLQLIRKSQLPGR
jgi:hypothetical protein